MARVRTEKFADALHTLGTLRPDAPLGVLDIGSNSVRLVGYSGSARTPVPIYNGADDVSTLSRHCRAAWHC